MNPAEKPSDSEVRVSDRFKRHTHRNDLKAFWWGTWLILLVALSLGRSALQGFRSHQWINIAGLGQSDLVVPWWISAIFSLCAFLTSLWCFSRYLKLKAS